MLCLARGFLKDLLQTWPCCEVFFTSIDLTVLAQVLRSARGISFDLPCAKPHEQVRDESFLSLPKPMWLLDIPTIELGQVYRDSITEVIWFTLSRRQFQDFLSTALAILLGLVTVGLSPTTWISALPVNFCLASQSSWGLWWTQLHTHEWGNYTGQAWCTCWSHQEVWNPGQKKPGDLKNIEDL